MTTSVLSLSEYPTWPLCAGYASSRWRAENQRRVGAAEAERVRQRVANALRSSLEWNQIEIAIGGGLVEVERGWEHAVAHSEQREDGFDRAGSAEQVASGRFGRRHRERVGVRAE